MSLLQILHDIGMNHLIVTLNRQTANNKGRSEQDDTAIKNLLFAFKD